MLANVGVRLNRQLGCGLKERAMRTRQRRNIERHLADALLISFGVAIHCDPSTWTVCYLFTRPLIIVELSK